VEEKAQTIREMVRFAAPVVMGVEVAARVRDLTGWIG